MSIAAVRKKKEAIIAATIATIASSRFCSKDEQGDHRHHLPASHTQHSPM